MKTEFRVKKYDLVNEKLSTEPLRIAFVSDLHGRKYDSGYSILFEAIEAAEVDLILITGDMLSRKSSESIKQALRFFKMLSGRWPVYYAPGNHESWYKVKHEKIYKAYEKKLKDLGITVLCNEKRYIDVRDNHILVSGLELPLLYYRKIYSKRPDQSFIKELIGEHRKKDYEILLAHNPRFGKEYLDWGADLILSGHYHGAVVRLTENIGLISPQFHLFPRFCCGIFSRGKQRMIVSPGLGEHTINLRIHNPRELIILNLVGKKTNQKHKEE